MASKRSGNGDSSDGRQIKKAVLSSKIDSIRVRPYNLEGIFCPHCQQRLSSKTYRKHKMLFYNPTTEIWTTVKMEIDNVSGSGTEETVCESDTSSQAPDLPILDSESNSVDDTSNEVLDVESEPEPEQENHDSSDSECWEDNDESLETDFPSTDCDIPDMPHNEDSSCLKEEHALLTWLVLFIVRLQAKFYLPDTAISCLLKFIYALLCIIGRNNVFVTNMIANFPTSVYRLKRFFGWKESFVRFVVCRQCYSVYEFEKCVQQVGANVVSKNCTYRAHPNTRTRTCNSLLLKTVHLQSGKIKLIPFKVYCYISLQESLQKFLLYPGFIELCEQWRTHKDHTSLSDIYDGKLWRDFQFIDNQPYLASPHVYAFLINIDWFQPYNHTNASVGAIYLTIMNLPCTIRYKREYTILLGIIPGPSEPEKNINQYLRPLVKELQQFFVGIPMKMHGYKDKQVVKCLLIGVACDMPAGRKVCGFLSHSALLGCSRCLKVFPGEVGSKNYSGFERGNWKPRTNEEHRAHVRLIQSANTKTERDKLESKYGCRYSVLLELSYFDPTRMLLVDPMHNLFLGTAKHMTKLWNERKILSKDILKTIQTTIDSMSVPSDVGRIPRKIETSFSGFTADQFKNWVILYSIPSLHGLIDEDHLECWRHFVLACRLLVQKSISITDVNMADALLVQFCRRVERMYGTTIITPNMHMHCHLKDVILDYGPVYAYWLFSYERFNGILEHQPTSNHSIEIQVMRRFMQDNSAFAFQPPEEYRDELAALCTLKPNLTGSLMLTNDTPPSNSIEFPSTYKYHVLTDYEVNYLKQCISLHIPSIEITVNSMCQYFKIAFINGVRYSCSSPNRLSVALTHWDENIFGHPPTALIPSTATPVNPSDVKIRPFKINYFAKTSYSVSIGSKVEIRHFICAMVSWFQPHPSRYDLGKPVQVWCKNFFERCGNYSFLPLDELCFTNINRCVHMFTKVNPSGEKVLVVSPITT